MILRCDRLGSLSISVDRDAWLDEPAPAACYRLPIEENRVLREQLAIAAYVG
jgi:hypothetical protein